MGSDGLVSASVAFSGGAKLIYCIESSPACVDPVAQFSDGQLSIRLPKSWVSDWVASDDRVAISSEQQLDQGEVLKILVEKDFACLAPREGEDESDMYPHPQQGKANC